VSSPPEDGHNVASPPDGGQGEPPVPVCYRHPGRQTYVSCVRCGRPACPDCLRPAAVGHQCVDCIKGGNQGVRRATGQFGGSVVAGARVTWCLIGLNIVLYIVQLAHPNLANDWQMIGGAVGSGGQLVGVATGQWYRMITSAFLPGTGNLGILDILFNMWALFIVGPALERVLGAVRYLAVYLISAIGGSVLYYFLVQPNQPALGASGAIFGLFGAWFVLSRRMGLDSRQVILLIVLNLGIGFAVPFIAWQAHVGGLIAGGLLTAAYAYAPRQNRTVIQVLATLAMLAILIVGVLIRNHQLLGTYSFYQGRLF
jgi:membrane associated rhomboid family serine protease